ncbi:hypothetical protein M231_04862 [Tremella mesenterica]|uniref:Uncharacterized protein n=1 Tax=Tremella mesenterica TaxID=5217 RepID=A0A4Q1BJH8_TREME|nr:hypothetical protein M231_04862 [Tremella mesenterica]
MSLTCKGYAMAHTINPPPSGQPIDPYAILPCPQPVAVPPALSERCRESHGKRSCAKAAYCSMHWCGFCKKATRASEGNSDLAQGIQISPADSGQAIKVPEHQTERDAQKDEQVCNGSCDMDREVEPTVTHVKGEEGVVHQVDLVEIDLEKVD